MPGILAHRLATIATMDRRVVPEGGRIAADGAHAGLPARDGAGAARWRRRSGGLVGDGHPAFAVPAGVRGPVCTRRRTDVMISFFVERCHGCLAQLVERRPYKA
jgi:hypothetical protein